MRKIAVSLLAIMLVLGIGCACAPEAAVDQLVIVAREIVDESDVLVATHPDFQVTPEMTEDERALTEARLAAKLARNQQFRDTLDTVEEALDED